MIRKKLVIFDGHALVHRGFHAIPFLTSKDGTPTNAVYGFTTMMLLALKELKPEYVVVAWDAPGKTFRHSKYSEYKATRKKAPDELYAQFPLTKEVVAAFNIPLIEQPGYEADDIIGTLSKQYEQHYEVIIVTGDMDELQLVSEHTKVYTMRKGFTDTVLYGPAEVQAKYGVNPQEFIVYKALKGDSSDNIPGVAGIGDKGATELVSAYKTLDGIYANLAEIKPALQKKLQAGREMAYLSEDLSTIDRNMNIDFDIQDALLHNYNEKAVYDVFHKYEFKSLLTKLPKKTEATESSQSDIFETSIVAAGEFNRDHLKNVEYKCVDTVEKLQDLATQLSKQKVFAFDTETDSIDQVEANLVGASFCFAEAKAYYVPLKHTGEGAESQVSYSDFVEILGPVLQNKHIGKVGHNLKYDYVVLKPFGVELRPIVFDTMVAAFMLNPIGRAQSLSQLAYSELGISMIDILELIGKKGKNQQTFNAVPVADAVEYACEDADISWRLYQKLLPEIARTGDLEKLGTRIEWPLIAVLGNMEYEGVELDKQFLATLQATFAKRITKLRESIWGYAGSEFNVSSPAQLQTVLFTNLKIDSAGLKKLKTGISTAHSELEKLRGRHPIVEQLFEYRELTKLQSTYVEALPQLVKPDGRVHTNYNQTIAQTGRLSSTNPNLQNIPVRTEVGKQIRNAFVAGNGNVLVSADYSQIELRLAAELAGDEAMIRAFVDGADIHTETAAEMFGIDSHKVEPHQRYAAKTINFGVLYGMNTHGLSAATGFDYAQSKEFIDRYFESRKAVADYILAVKKFALEKGYTETLFGRRRPCPDVKSSNYIVRSAAERAAVNMPLQGTAADMIKLAMIRLQAVLAEDSKLILQIHDEVIVECPEAKSVEVAEILRQEMIAVHKFRVPIEVGIKIGKNWGELE